MASKFTAGMTNVVQVLNEMWDKFAAGPYNALPLTGGALTGPVTSTSRITADVLVSPRQIIAGSGDFASASSIRSANDGSPGQANAFYEVASMSVASVPELSNSGRFYWSTASTGSNSSSFLANLSVVASGGTASTVLQANGAGDLSIRRYLTAGPLTTATTKHRIYSNVAEFAEILQVGRTTTASPCFSFNGSNGLAGWGNGKSVFYVGKNSETSRSINATGTVNAGGADYAEYMLKSRECGTIAPGQIVGIDADGRLTDKWGRAIAFMVKSTDPCMVGGDRWAQHLGQRPTEPARLQPNVEQVLVTPAVPADEASGTEAVAAVYESVTTAPGDTDDEWAAKQAAHMAAVAAFDMALEVARQTVDRIAFAGQVPVNVLGATPGQYIVPVQEGEGIAGQAVDRGDMTLDQYMSAIGRVIAIEEDGRARIIVKVA